MDYRNDIQQLARAHQFRLHPLALKGLSDYLATLNGNIDAQRNALRDIFALLHRACGLERFVDGEKVKSVVSLHSSKVQGAIDGVVPTVDVLSLDDTPYAYIDEWSGEVRVQSTRQHGDRFTVLNQRYLFARKRCLRSGLFSRDSSKQPIDQGLPSLVPSIALEGIDPSDTVAVLGMLVKHSSATYLEDIYGRVKLIMRGCVHPPVGVVGEGFFVVVKGQWVGGLFVVASVDLPPAERREDTLRVVGSDFDLFGRRPDDVVAAFRREKTSLGSVVIVMSQIHLDQRSTVDSLISFFREMQNRSEAELTDTTLVMVGEFCSSPIHYDDVSHLPEPFEGCDRYRSLMNILATVITVHAPSVAQLTQVVIVPGCGDITGLLGVLPQPPIVSTFGKVLQARLKKVVLAPNPCRLRFFTHEMIVVRRDFSRSLREKERTFEWSRHEASTPVISFESIAKTILDEAHLAPGVTEGILWKADKALCLPVLPHLLVMCDSTEQWECSYKGVRIVNPGPFSLGKTFLWYTPADGECSLSSVDDQV
ncbi:DNA polymerase epsilon subunit b, putative [Trypanosoma equiperdum]|uniref:DNA polymerase II subunit 2 n=2 Tax=Trypanozoon TaxID=39700 RepID=Q38CZ7_TRYB2|nr:DNA polymerase epsilon subunit B, putative [Trypanosoma brucei brucei TREU927]EAN77323.1 DNA polymerase epsilon subunit B, putative [Trypanosoma brucei brucei TREU927]SCU65629.1 DNA polymerase epsilon subunit b, putative [Trypanosoma equiperdum]